MQHYCTASSHHHPDRTSRSPHSARKASPHWIQQTFTFTNSPIFPPIGLVQVPFPMSYIHYYVWCALTMWDLLRSDPMHDHDAGVMIAPAAGVRIGSGTRDCYTYTLDQICLKTAVLDEFSRLSCQWFVAFSLQGAWELWERVCAEFLHGLIGFSAVWNGRMELVVRGREE